MSPALVDMRVGRTHGRAERLQRTCGSRGETPRREGETNETVAITSFLCKSSQGVQQDAVWRPF
jgi:hypothetical protein